MKVRIMIVRPGVRARPTGEVVDVVVGSKFKAHFRAKIGNAVFPSGTIATVRRLDGDRGAWMAFPGATETFYTRFDSHHFWEPV